MFDMIRDQAESLRRIFHPSAPSLVPLACAGAVADCRHYAEVVMNRLERTGARPVLIDRLDEATDLDHLDDFSGHRRVLLLDEPARLARWLGKRQQSMLLLLSHHREALPSQYATIKAIALAGQIRRFGTFFVDAQDATEASDAHQRLASCAARFLSIAITPLCQVNGTLATMTDASLARLQDYSVPLGADQVADISPRGRQGIAH